jgi:hypothetical protein
MTTKNEKCLFDGMGPQLNEACPEKASSRGLCKVHYQYALRLVSRGKTTWPALEEAGKAAPAQRVRSATTAWFLGDEHHIQE